MIHQWSGKQKKTIQQQLGVYMNRCCHRLSILLILLLSSLLLGEIKIFDKKDIKVSLGIDAAFNGEITYKEVEAGFTVDAAEITINTNYKEKFKLHLSIDPSKPNSSSKDGHTKPLEKLYFQLNARELLRIRVGQFKVPFGFEQFYNMQERSLITHRKSTKEICPGLDRGVMFFGKNIGNRFTYYTGLFNGTSVEQSLNSVTLLAPIKLQYNKKFSKAELTTGVNSYLRVNYPYNLYFKYRWANGFFSQLSLKTKQGNDLTFLGEFLERLEFRDLKNSAKDWEIGGFLISSYRIENVEPVLFAELYDKNVNLDDTGDKRLFGGGVNFHYFKDRLRLSIQIEYESRPYAQEDNITAIMSLRGFL